MTCPNACGIDGQKWSTWRQSGQANTLKNNTTTRGDTEYVGFVIRRRGFNSPCRLQHSKRLSKIASSGCPNRPSSLGRYGGAA
jgi:hypothetical protein